MCSSDLEYEAYLQELRKTAQIELRVREVPLQLTGPIPEDGKGWELRHPAHAPPARYDAALAYDGHHRRIMLVGGTEAAFAKDQLIDAAAHVVAEIHLLQRDHVGLGWKRASPRPALREASALRAIGRRLESQPHADTDRQIATLHRGHLLSRTGPGHCQAGTKRG